MNKANFIFLFLFIFGNSLLRGQTVNVSVDLNAERKPISPLIYGMNNALSDNSSDPLTNSEWQKLKDAGVRMVREFGGNNGTKYNWRLKLSSHPDWYNNVYPHNWNFAAQSLLSNLPAVQGMWCFQLIGKAASNTNNNFNDWAYNQSQWWSGVNQNLAGGGTPNGASGNPNLYLMNWTADSTVGILNYWFDNLGLNKNYLKYWSMDNEPEIWSGTHDDVMPTQLSAEAFMQKYFDVAKKARAAFPEIKLLGPVTCNEWQWYNWDNATINYNGKNYCWLEFFIKRISEEQASSGIRLLDVLDIHFYPGASDATGILQMHRVFFDDTYIYPGANGVHNVNGSWDNTQNKEYIFKRCNDWLTQYLGANHGITLSLSEMDINTSNVNLIANWYASMLGTFAKNGVEIFTPWSWKTGMWEVLHLFSSNTKPYSVKAMSDNEQYLSAFASANSSNDSITFILVNRSQSSTYQVDAQFANYNLANGNYKTLTLSNLPSSETFVSKNNNALASSQSTANSGKLSVSIAPLTIKAVLITSTTTGLSHFENAKIQNLNLKYLRNGNIKIEYYMEKSSRLQIKITDMAGREISEIVNKNLPEGNYTYEIHKESFPAGLYVVSAWENKSLKMSAKLKF